MFAIALAVSFGDDGAPSDSVGAMLDAWPCSAPDGRAIASAVSGTAGVSRWAVVDADRRVAPIWDAERQLLFVGDVRLYDRGALSRALDVGATDDDVSDAEIAWRAYLRWGEDSPRHLVGDFAFAVWDERKRSVFVARDHFGVRPLYYSVDSRRAFVASDVRQLLAVTPQPAANIDAQAILERFSGGVRTHGRTFFRNVSTLPAGHTATIASGRCHPRRYWLPSFEPRRAVTADDHAEIRTLFRQAVRDRLASNHAIVAHSSGGVDSSAIVMAADEIYRDEPNRPPLVMASATTPGMPCDDSQYMDAVARRVGFEGVRWNALEPNLADIEAPVIAYPGLRRGIGGGPRRDLRLARERDARVLLHGFFGDGLMYAYGISRDMLRAGLWRELHRYALAGKGTRARIRLLGRSLTGLLTPALALRTLNRIDNRSWRRRPPGWMGPELRRRYPPPAQALDLPDVDWPSHLACELWAHLTGPRTAAVVDATVAYGAEDGVEIRLPYLDVRLAQKLLDVSWQARLPRRGEHRRLNRDVFAPLLPAEFAGRVDQGSWMPVWALGARRMLPAIDKIFSDGEWLSAPYVDIDEARTMLAEAMARGDSIEPGKLLLVKRFAAVEAWLRQVFRYDTRREELTCPTNA